MYKRSFLKWAGGKYSVLEILIPVLKRFLNDKVEQTYIEPFLGSGTVFLNFADNINNILIADINAELINIILILSSQEDEFIEEVRKLFSQDNNSMDGFVRLRKRFNVSKDDFERAILFIYLNRHCFNGLCRFNSKGEFNTSFGKYKKPYFPEDELRLFAKKIRDSNAVPMNVEYNLLMSKVGYGDIVYCDPPYVDLSKTSSFKSYTKDGFGMNKQIDLASLAKEKMDEGAAIIISNHDTPETRELYKGATELIFFEAPRFISGNGDRSKAKELLAIYFHPEILN